LLLLIIGGLNGPQSPARVPQTARDGTVQGSSPAYTDYSPQKSLSRPQSASSRLNSSTRAGMNSPYSAKNVGRAGSYSPDEVIQQYAFNTFVAKINDPKRNLRQMPSRSSQTTSFIRHGRPFTSGPALDFPTNFVSTPVYRSPGPGDYNTDSRYSSRNKHVYSAHISKTKLPKSPQSAGSHVEIRSPCNTIGGIGRTWV